MRKRNNSNTLCLSNVSFNTNVVFHFRLEYADFRSEQLSISNVLGLTSFVLYQEY